MFCYAYTTQNNNELYKILYIYIRMYTNNKNIFFLIYNIYMMKKNKQGILKLHRPQNTQTLN